ncbi:MAG TPA: protein-L-isoaspartate(D-aspartate) O-methyltransferase, partial [Gammaproteobacteria bacterium]
MAKMRVHLCVVLAFAAFPVWSQPGFDELRQQMVAEIMQDMRRTAGETGRTALDQTVLDAIASVPRHEFVPPRLQSLAYLNRPLPIGEGQTISQPFIVALMTDLAEVDASSRVLEIGTGSGYQAAILAEIVDHVYTIEIVESLGRQAAETIARLGYENVTSRIGDGYRGMPEFAPFDAIIVTAAPEQVPEPLIEQLRPGGRLVIPVGPIAAVQSLQVLEKSPTGEISSTHTIPVVFVPLTRD